MINLSRLFFKNNIVYILVLVFLLSSCLTINTDMKLNSNGSGTVKISYKLDKGLSGISNLDSNNDIAPLNLSEDYIKEITQNRDDIVYKDYSLVDDEFFVVIDVTFVFESIDALNSIFPEENGITIYRDGNETVFEQTIVESSTEVLTDETLEIFNDIFSDHLITFNVEVPSEIVSVKNGFKTDKRLATYNESLLDIITTSDEKNWSIRW
jgi:hypothetical protein